MYYISMDSSRQALQTNGKFFQILIFFIIFKVLAKKKIQKDCDASILIKILCIMQHFIWLCLLFESNSSLWYIIMGGIASLIIM